MEIYVGRDCTNLRPKSGDLVGKHTRRRSLDSVIPIIVIVAQSVSEVQNGHLADVG